MSNGKKDLTVLHYLKSMIIGTAFFSGACNAFCFSEAGDRYGVDPLLLISIAQVESSMNPKAINKNKNKSIDVGLMQINSIWFSILGKSWGITKDSLIEDPCQNVYVGAYILALNIKKNGVNWKSIGAYNAGFSDKNEPKREVYSKKIYNLYVDLLKRNRQQVIATASNGKSVR